MSCAACTAPNASGNRRNDENRCNGAGYTAQHDAGTYFAFEYGFQQQPWTRNDWRRTKWNA